MSDLPKAPEDQLDWLTTYISDNQADLRPEVVAGLVLKLVDSRIRLVRLRNGQEDDEDLGALQRELSG